MTVEEKNKYINHLKKVNSKYDETRYEINQTLVKSFSKIYINHQHIKFNVSNKVLEKIIFEPDFDNIDFDSLEKDYYPKIFTSKISLSALLSCLDLTGINFDNVKLSGICFSNVKGVKIINPVDDINYEISCILNYTKYLDNQIKRLEKISEYNIKRETAKNNKKREYYAESMKLMFEKGEDFRNYKYILEEYRTAYLKRKEIIDSLFDEIKIIKKLKV